MSHTIFIIHRERFAPVSLTAEYGVAQTVVDFYLTYTLLFYKFLCLGDGVFYLQTVKIKFI